MMPAALLAVPLSAAAASGTLWGPAPGWPADGITVVGDAYSYDSARFQPDGAGGMVVCWQDGRDVPAASCHCRNKDDLYAQRVSPAGALAWTRSGAAVCTWPGLWGGSDLLAGWEPAGRDLWVAVWIHQDGPDGTFAQLVDGDGRLRTGTTGVTLYEHLAGVKWADRSARDGRGTVWLGFDGPGATVACLSAVRIAGTAFVCGPVRPVAPGQTLLATSLAPVANGVLVFDARLKAAGNVEVRVARVVAGSDPAKAARSVLWTGATDGVPLATAPDGRGGAWVAWTAGPGSGAARRLFLDAVDDAGRPRWPAPRAVGPVEPFERGFALAASSRRGEAALAWGEPKADHLTFRSFGADGSARASATGVVFGAPAPTWKRVALAPAGKGWAALWVGQEPDGGQSIRLTTLPPAGDPFVLDRAPGLEAEVDRLTVAPDGSLWASWVDNASGGHPSRLRLLRLTPR